MKNVTRSNLACLFVIIVCLFTSNLRATPVDLTFHTDNPLDLTNLKANKPSSVATATNLLVLSRLKQKFNFAYMTTTRSMLYMKKQQDICVVNRLKTPQRESQFIFSQPVNVYLTKQLFQSARYNALPEQLLDENGAVYLPELFARYPQRTIVYSSQVSQGGELDAQLKLVPEQNKIIRNGGAHDNGVIGMFRRQRADYVLLFPQSLVEGTGVGDGVISYPIAKTKMFLLGYFMCADTPKMRGIVAQMNQILAQLQQQGLLYQTHLKW